MSFLWYLTVPVSMAAVYGVYLMSQSFPAETAQSSLSVPDVEAGDKPSALIDKQEAA